MGCLYIDLLFFCVVFFFKQKTAYEMRISDWSSDVCSSDLAASMIDTGVVCRRIVDGADTLGILLNWRKRYITLSPVATVLGLAFKLSDQIGRASCRERVCQYV